MQKIAEARGDPMSRFHNALYVGDVHGRINVLRDVGMCEFDSIELCHCLIPIYRPIGISDGSD